MASDDVIRPAVRAIRPYAPGTTVTQAKARFGFERVVKLSSNENPLGASPRALAALADLADVHIYLDEDHAEVRTRLAARHGVSKDHIVLGHGSNEVFHMIFATCVAPGDEVVYAEPTFSLFAKNTALFEGVPVTVPLRAGVHDLDAMLAAVTPKTKLVIICDPNNPTGTMIARAAFDRFVAALPSHVVLLVDQAYRDYMPPEGVDAMAYVRVRPRTIVTRTMSKLYGLASLRFGYGVASPDLLAFVQRVRVPFNVSRPAAMAALAALDDDAFVARTLAVNAQGMRYLTGEFARLGLAAYPSAANFLAVGVPVSATEAYEALLACGIVVRSGDGLGMPGYLRITIGTHEENEALIGALDALVPTWPQPASALV